MRKSGLLSRRLTRGRFASTRPILEMLEDRTLLDGSGDLPSFPFETNPNDYATDQIIVRFREGVNPALTAVAAVPGATVDSGELLTGHNMWTVNLPSGISVTDAVAAYSADPNVLYAEPDYILHANLTPNDPRYANGSLWGLHNTGQSGGTNDADIDAPEAWNLTTGNSTVVIAVIDTGVDYNHPDLVANMWRDLGEIPGNGVDDDSNGFIDDVYGYDFANNDGDPFDDNSHGTHVSGTIGGVGNNGVGVVGVNWNVKIMALKFLTAGGSGQTSNAVKCLNYAVAQGVLVSSNSYGGGGPTQAFSDALTAARNVGHVFVAAAGNSHPAVAGASYPARYPHDNIISVASTDRNDNLAGSSQRGVGVDLAAPGVAIVSTTPGNTYSTFSGTSMATPHVAGVVGLIKSINPVLPYIDVINAIRNNVDVKAQLNLQVETNGRLNAFRAVSSILPPSDTSGPYVISQTPSGLVGGPIDEIIVTFNENVDASTFTQADIVQFSGPGGVNLKPQINSITPNNGQVTTFSIKFNSQSALGPYTIVFGPDIKDTIGNKMNQDLDANNGEDPQDIYTGTFTIGDAAGAQVISQTPVATAPAPISNVTVTFNELINATTFTIADVTAFTGPGGVDLLSSLLTVLPPTGSALTFTITFAAQNTAGDYSLTFGPTILDTSGNPMDQDGDGANGEALEDQYTLDFTLTSTTIDTHDSNDIPKDIKDRKTATSKINVSDDFTIQDVNVKFWITHTWDSDLRIQLKSPKGTLITLVNFRGGAGDNFGSQSQHTTMDDEATTAISAGTAPFLSSYRPENNNQLSKFDNENAKGTWTLSIYDRSNGDIGTLNRWSLVITGVPGGPIIGGGAGGRSFASSGASSPGPVALLLPGKKESAPAPKQTGGKNETAPARSTPAGIQAADSYFAAVEVGAPRRVYIPSTADSTLRDLAATLTL